jgi:uncharacterized membrane protein
MSGLPLMGSSPTTDGDEDRGPGPLDASEVWTDPLDDSSFVYQTTDVLISAGEVRLAPGKDVGWIASEIIPAKLGYRYDFVLLEADLPGNSTVQISILNASTESSEIGFANETISGFKKVNGTYLSLRTIDPNLYPVLRVQVNLVADGANRPMLQEWSLYFLPLDEWRDDFLGPWKMEERRGLNFTDGQLEINLTSKSRIGPGSYRVYPPVVVNGPTLFYPNAGRTGYDDGVSLGITDAGTAYGVSFLDMNDDGHLDIVQTSRDKTYICWGDGTEEWTKTGATVFIASNYINSAGGDVDNDGDTDLVIASKISGLDRNVVYFNQGDGTFNSTYDLQFSTAHHEVAVGDINYDGFDDIIYCNQAFPVCYYGGPGGPDTTVDLFFPVSDSRDVVIEDLDGDGYIDVFIAGENNQVYLGDENGVDAISDYSLSPFGFGMVGGGVGDINADGFTDLLIFSVASYDRRVRVFEGSAQGWSNSSFHETKTGMERTNAIDVGDVDKDGYDDLLIHGEYENSGKDQLLIYYGGTTLSFTPDVTIDSDVGASALDIAIPQVAGFGRRTYRGTFTTETISLPSNQWNWDMVHLEGSTPPNTTMTITVLDSSDTPIPGFEGLSEWNVDLLANNRNLNDTIKIRVDITSESNTTTPILERLTVRWMYKMTWRDQFYGEGRSQRLMGVDVTDGSLFADATSWSSPQLIFSSLRDEADYYQRSHVFFDSGGLDFLSRSPMEYQTRGTAAFDVADVDGNGFLDIVFATHQTSDTIFAATSPLFLTSATGWQPQAAHSFPTTGASDVLLEDLNDDGHIDVVFAQEMEAQGDYTVNSTLFWGSAEGWSDTPDVEFITTGAVDVEAFDHDGDDDMDLVFACYKATSTDIDSLVFTQGPDGFNGSAPSIYLGTKAARAVAAADLDSDTYMDLVFANSFSGGLAEIDSWIYWGTGPGSFGGSPTGLPTVGAEDVKIADVNGDSYPDIVFANSVDNGQSREVSSYVYLNDGSGGFASSPDHVLPSTGAVAVAVTDLDGTGWKDLVFACQHNGTSYSTPSMVYLGGSSGWSSSPDIVLPTEGASDVMVAQLTRAGYGGYISKAITPDPADDTGTFHTLRYTADLGASQRGTIQLVDAFTEEVLAETPITSGTNEWSLEGLFWFKEHSSIRVAIIGEGLDLSGSFEIDEIWMNWTKRVHGNPMVQGLDISSPQVYRTRSVDLQVNATDEYDLPRELRVWIWYRLNGTDPWETFLLSQAFFLDVSKKISFTPRVDTLVGSYDFKAKVQDSDDGFSPEMEFHNLVLVSNNIPTEPMVTILQASPTTTSTLEVEVTGASHDVESSGLSYIYRWYLDGVLQEDIVENYVSSSLTQRGQNWSVEVSAWDTEDESQPGRAWRVIQNAGPAIQQPLIDVEFDEDTVDSDQVDLSDAFWDPDGDDLTWTVDPTPQHLTVEIDPTTGQVTITPQENWNGNEDITFIASDGELLTAQTVKVTVFPVNDIPRFATVNGVPVDEGPVEMTIQQGGLLEIDVLVLDEEGDELVFDTNSTLIDLDGATGSISWQHDDDQAGKLHFSLSVWDIVTPAEKVTIDFIITVENENDPMTDPVITNPSDGASFEEDTLFSLIAICSDPDTVSGQILNFSWSSNLSGHIGYGSSLDIALTDVGTHVITLTVTDGEFEKMVTVSVDITVKEVVEPPPNGGSGGSEEPLNYVLIVGIVAAIVVIGTILFVARTRKRTEEGEVADEEEYKRDHMERAHAAVKEAADTLEAGKAEKREEDLLPEPEDVDSAAMPQMSLSMEAKKTEAASAQTMALFADDGEAEPVMSEEEAENLRVDNLKRKYQNAIGGLPYGIPSEELRDWDSVELAGALAKGEKKMTHDGRETTEIDGRWYFSDPNDTGSFLKEHGAKAEPKKKAAVTTDKTALLAKLEERFILGEISEEAYNKLVEKYSKE